MEFAGGMVTMVILLGCFLALVSVISVSVMVGKTIADYMIEKDCYKDE